MKQVVVVHGGETFQNLDDLISYLQNKVVTAESFKAIPGWKENLQRDLGKDFEVFYLRMPDRESARYIAWKVWFEKLLPFLNDGVILIGHSLGGIFFAKYFSENICPKKVGALFIVAAPYGYTNNRHAKNDNFYLNDNIQGITDQVPNTFILQSKDDAIVPFSDFEIYKEKLPKAKTVVFETEGHFNRESLPGLVELIKKF